MMLDGQDQHERSTCTIDMNDNPEDWILDIDGLTKGYASGPAALAGIDLRIRRGELFAPLTLVDRLVSIAEMSESPSGQLQGALSPEG